MGWGQPESSPAPCLIAAQHGLKIRGRTLAQEMARGAMQE